MRKGRHSGAWNVWEFKLAWATQQLHVSQWLGAILRNNIENHKSKNLYHIYCMLYVYHRIWYNKCIYIYIIYYNIYIYTCICLYFITYMIICTFTDTVVKQISNHLDSSPPSWGFKANSNPELSAWPLHCTRGSRSDLAALLAAAIGACSTLEPGTGLKSMPTTEMTFPNQSVKHTVQ